MSATAGGGGVGRVLKKLAKSVQDGNYYEAHQMYHSVCQRYLKQKKFDDALELLHQGAKNMLEHDQLGSAEDLAQRMMDIYDSEGLKVDDKTRARVVDLFQDFPLRTEQCDQYVRMCLRWSGKHSACPAGDPLMHHAFGSRYYKEKQYYDAEYHFIYGTADSAKALGHMIWEWSGEGYFPDRGYFIARAVLQSLALKEIHHANITFETFIKDLKTNDPESKGIPLPFKPTDASPPEVFLYKSSLINFTQFLLLCVQRKAGEQFASLKNQYRSVVGFDSFLVHMVEKIGEVFFGLGPKKVSNPLEDMMKSLFAPPPSALGHSSPAQILEMD
ncbi:hypothetical protein SpCBS45565_g03954 [Spizellomyces sp. 'palustris']|nr:hypothetical protein SpCBS45565_g03954 [Spizellomyces sp. 'palustris']